MQAKQTKPIPAKAIRVGTLMGQGLALVAGLTGDDGKSLVNRLVQVVTSQTVTSIVDKVTDLTPSPHDDVLDEMLIVIGRAYKASSQV